MNNKVKVFWISFLVLVLLTISATVAMAQGEEPPIELPQISALSLSLNIAAGMSLLFDYAPGLAAWWDALTVAQKRLGALITAVAIVGLVFGLTCAGIVSSNLICTRAGAWDAISNIVLVFAVGQGTHAGTKPTPKFKAKVLSFGVSQKGG